MSVPAGYKASEVGVIPVDWEAVPLGDLFTFKNGLNKAKQYFGYGTPIVNYMDVYRYPALRMPMVAGRVDVNKTELDSYSVQKGDVFFTRTSETVDEIGVASAMLDEANDTVFSGFVLRARPKNADLADAFKAYAFRSEAVRQQIVSKATYTTRALTNGGALSAAFLAKPPTAEQIAIAEALSDVDEAIAAQEAVIAKKRALKTATMQALLSGTRRLPGFSREWELKALGGFCTFITGPFGSSVHKSDYVDWGTPLINPMHIVDGILCPSARMTVGSEVAQRLASFRLKPGDVIIGRRGEMGRCAVVRSHHDGWLCGTGSIIVRPNGNGCGDFIQRILSSPEIRDKITESSVGTTMINLNQNVLAQITVQMPCLNEQEAISVVLNDLDDELSQQESKLTKLRHLKTGMMQQLLTGKIRLI